MDEVIMGIGLHLLQNLIKFEHEFAALNQGIPHGCASIRVYFLEYGRNGRLLCRLEPAGREISTAKQCLKLI
jgi:hypothetical protein